MHNSLLPFIWGISDGTGLNARNTGATSMTSYRILLNILSTWKWLISESSLIGIDTDSLSTKCTMQSTSVHHANHDSREERGYRKRWHQHHKQNIIINLW